MDVEASFPESNSKLPPNVLFSPLVDTLQKGKSYNFKIKCKYARQIFFYDGNDLFELTKNNDIFSKQLTISNTATKCIVAGYILDSQDISLFYFYNLS